MPLKEDTTNVWRKSRSQVTGECELSRFWKLAATKCHAQGRAPGCRSLFFPEASSGPLSYWKLDLMASGLIQWVFSYLFSPPQNTPSLLMEYLLPNMQLICLGSCWAGWHIGLPLVPLTLRMAKSALWYFYNLQRIKFMKIKMHILYHFSI